MTKKDDSPAGEKLSDDQIDELLTSLDSEARKQDQDCKLPLREPQWSELRPIVRDWVSNLK